LKRREDRRGSDLKGGVRDELIGTLFPPPIRFAPDLQRILDFERTGRRERVACSDADFGGGNCRNELPIS
jgi:hypothetical protein